MLQAKCPAKPYSHRPAVPRSPFPYTATRPSRSHAHTPAAIPASRRRSTPRSAPPPSPNFSAHPTASFFILRLAPRPSGGGNLAPAPTLQASRFASASRPKTPHPAAISSYFTKALGLAGTLVT